MSPGLKIITLKIQSFHIQFYKCRWPQGKFSMQRFYRYHSEYAAPEDLDMLPLKTWIQRFQVPIPNPTERPVSTAIPSYLGILYLLGNFWSYTPVSAEITPFMAHFFAVCILTLFNPTSSSVYS